jgi:hypothetical protein
MDLRRRDQERDEEGAMKLKPLLMSASVGCGFFLFCVLGRAFVLWEPVSLDFGLWSVGARYGFFCALIFVAGGGFVWGQD